MNVDHSNLNIVVLYTLYPICMYSMLSNIFLFSFFLLLLLLLLLLILLLSLLLLFYLFNFSKLVNHLPFVYF